MLAPATLPLRAKAGAKGQTGVLAAAAAMTGNLAAPEPMNLANIAGHADKGGVLHELREQWQQLQAAHSSVINWAVSAFSRVSLLGAVAPGASARSTAATSTNTAATNSASSSSSASMPPTATTAFDFDGDDKADIAFWRPSDGTWWVLQSSTQELTMRQWGAAGDRIVPADYDGDGKTDYAVYTPSSGMWNVLLSSNGQVLTRQWGTSTDVPVASDFDGDGKADTAV